MAFVTFEGIEGCGKSTQARLLVKRLGPGALLTKEPGGTAVGAAIRRILLDPEQGELSPLAESLLYFADRAQHVAQVVRPALASGLTVVSDRYVESSLAYQGFGRGLPLPPLKVVAELATGGLRPDAIVLVDVSLEEGLARAARRGRPDRLEGESRAFHERVRGGYERLLRDEPDRWLRVMGEAPAAEVAERVFLGLRERGIVSGPA